MPASSVSDARPPIIVVGGGIVGLATAVALGERGVRTVVLEAESVLGAHQSGHNSGVIHSGLYYKPGSLKAITCRAGREAMYRFCEVHGIPHRRTGKVVVATTPDEAARLAQLRERGEQNGLEGVRELSRAELREIEPEAEGVAALWVPQTGIVDYVGVMEAMRSCIVAAGGEVRLGAAVRAVRVEGTAVTARTDAGTVEGVLLVNCAGLQCDRVARLCGVVPPIRIIPFKGEYYLLRAERSRLVRQPIYPVPDPAFPFLGVHFTPRVDGRVEAGPNAVLAWDRHGYTRPSFSGRDAWETLSWPGFWPLARRHWRTGFEEQRRSWSKALFVRSLQKLVPAVRDEDVEPAGCGIRAQAVDRHGALVDDFLVVTARRTVHVLNAPSPAATASLEIGRLIGERALTHPDLAGA